MMPTIGELEEQIRDLINHSRRNSELRQDAGLFSQLCSSLDVIGDTDLALRDYLESEQLSPSQGMRYLLSYGVLQALVLQQDAVQHLAESLGVAYHAPKELLEIRDVRNNSVGHPTKRGPAPSRAFNHISRATMSWKGFDLLTFRSSGGPEMESIDLPGLIETQRRLLAAALLGIAEAERSREQDHRRRYRSDRLMAVFGTGFDYAFQKLREELQGDRSPRTSMATVILVREAIERLRGLLADRGELPALQEHFDYHAAPALHSLERLQSFVENGPTDQLALADADNHWFRLRHELDDLRALTQEIDEEYQRDP